MKTPERQSEYGGRFHTTHVYRELWFALGVESDTGQRYLSIPVSLQITDYIEYYRISDERYRAFVEDPHSAVAFVDACRRREHDDLLIIPPPATNRGSAI